jgi:hypothetical protein
MKSSVGKSIDGPKESVPAGEFKVTATLSCITNLLQNFNDPPAKQCHQQWLCALLFTVCWRLVL